MDERNPLKMKVRTRALVRIDEVSRPCLLEKLVVPRPDVALPSPPERVQEKMGLEAQTMADVAATVWISRK